MSATRETVYRHRFMGSMIIVLLLLHLLVWWLPAPQDRDTAWQISREQEVQTGFDLPVVTRHRPAASSPPRPTSAPPVPVDRVEEDPVQLPELGFESTEPLPVGPVGGGSPGERSPVSDPDQPARVTQIVEPSREQVPESLRGGLIVHVSLLVDDEGRVVQVALGQITGARGESIQVDPEVERWLEPVLDAASRWRFRPAFDEGRPVWSETSVQFNL